MLTLGPSAFRYLWSTVHYRHRLTFSFASLRAASVALSRLRQEAFLVAESEERDGGSGEEWEAAFWGALEDDLHLPRAMAVVWGLVRSETPAGAKARLLRAFDQVLGLDLFAPAAEVLGSVRAMADERQELRTRSGFAKSDALRERIAAAGFQGRGDRDGAAP